MVLTLLNRNILVPHPLNVKDTDKVVRYQITFKGNKQKRVGSSCDVAQLMNGFGHTR